MKLHYIVKFVLLIAVFGMSGCTSFSVRLKSTFLADRPQSYPGLHKTGEILTSSSPIHVTNAPGYALLLIDASLSIAIDTMLLPLDIYGQNDFDQRADQQRYAEMQFAHQDQLARVHAKYVVDQITDQGKLGVLATRSVEPDVGMFVVDKLTDQVVLAQVARSQMDCDREIRIAALKKVTDQSVVFECAKSDRDPFFRQKAIGYLQNQNALAQLAEDGRSSAIFRLKDQQLIAQVAIFARTFEARYEAFRKLDLTGYSFAQKISPKSAPAIGGRIKAGWSDWSEEIQAADLKGPDAQSLLDAAILVGDSKLNCSNFEKLSIAIIRQGDESRVTELETLQQDLNDPRITATFLNCGQVELRRWTLAVTTQGEIGFDPNVAPIPVRWKEGWK